MFGHMAQSPATRNSGLPLLTQAIEVATEGGIDVPLENMTDRQQPHHARRFVPPAERGIPEPNDQRFHKLQRCEEEEHTEGRRDPLESTDPVVYGSDDLSNDGATTHPGPGIAEAALALLEANPGASTAPRSRVEEAATAVQSQNQYDSQAQLTKPSETTRGGPPVPTAGRSASPTGSNYGGRATGGNDADRGDRGEPDPLLELGGLSHWPWVGSGESDHGPDQVAAGLHENGLPKNL